MLEKYSAASERRRIKLGLISAITAVNLKHDGTSSTDQPTYQESGRKILEVLEDPDKRIIVRKGGFVETLHYPESDALWTALDRKI